MSETLRTSEHLPARRVVRSSSPFFTSSTPSDEMGSWGDREDTADRLAFEVARREQLAARPPHH